jgi:hypothetical protein
MSCRDFVLRLDDLLDDELEGDVAGALRAHVADCASCRAELASREAVLERARSLPATVPPERDLWPGIAERLRLKPRLRPSRWPAWLGAAAAVVMATAVVAGMLSGSRRPAAPARSGATALTASERDFQDARRALLAALEQRRGTLSEGTVRVVLEGVRVIDGAIATLARALDEHPGDGGLARRLAAVYHQEIDLLQRATRLPDET